MEPKEEADKNKEVNKEEAVMDKKEDLVVVEDHLQKEI